MSILKVVNGVLIRVLLGKCDVKIKVCIYGAHNEEELHSIGSNLVNKSVKRISFIASLAHFHTFRAFFEGNHLVNNDLYFGSIVAKRLNSVKHLFICIAV